MSALSTNAERSKARRQRLTREQRKAERLFYSKRRRVDLIKVLSPDGRCARCGEVFDHAELEVDHVCGRSWVARAVSMAMRAARYWREHRDGVKLRALCRGCSALDGGRRYGSNE